jgi:N6-adenosine-specific RNA methylase IME4
MKRTESAPINQIYGELKEDLFFTGFSFERGCQRLRKLLSGDGWKQCGGGFNNVEDFLNSLGLDQVAKLTEEKREIAKLIKALRPKVSVRKIASAIGGKKSTVHEVVSGKRTTKTKKAKQNNDALSGNRTALSGTQAAKTVARATRIADQQTNVAERVEKVALDAAGLGKFSVILADPPWDDEFGRSNRSIENHYPTMKFEDILALPVADIAHDQSMLFLWATPSMLPIALATAVTWGFEYRTMMVWVKPSIGLGKYARQRHEILLICRRGEHPAPAPEDLPDSVIEAPRGEHSAKPEVFHEIIERMYPTARRIELFRRGAARDNWEVWGAEAEVKTAAE